MSDQLLSSKSKINNHQSSIQPPTFQHFSISAFTSPPLAALFWIDPADPEAGGTGHTIRACRLQGIPVIFQEHWETWLKHPPQS